MGGMVWLLGYFHHHSMWTAVGAARWLTRPRAVRLIAVGTALVSLVALPLRSWGKEDRRSDHGRGTAGHTGPDWLSVASGAHEGVDRYTRRRRGVDRSADSSGAMDGEPVQLGDDGPRGVEH
jgi:hypothetical protein